MTCLALSVMLLLALFVPTADAASVFKRQKKSIFLVMDDSGSMGDNHGVTDATNANYSLQTLLAMTDKNDSVKLYFLNETFGISGKLDMTNKSNQLIEKVRDGYPYRGGGTPYSQVRKAQQELRDSARANDETDYWLVVVTDGSFDEETDGSMTNNDLRKFAGETLANGTHPNVLFISIGMNSAVDSTGLSNLHVVEQMDVISSMNLAAKTIASRVEAQDTRYSAGNAQITFTVPYPSANIVVFTQNKKVTITGHNALTPLNTSENYTVSYPVPNPKLGDSTVCFITPQDGTSIPMGEISLTFDKGLDPKNTTVLFEPAIGLTAHIFNQDGQEVDPASLRVGEKATIKFSLCDSKTNQPISDSSLGGPVSYNAVINGQNYQSNDFEFTVDSETLDIQLSSTLPDGYVLNIHNTYNDLTEFRNVGFSLSNGGMFHSDYSQLNQAPGTDANITLNGQPLTPEQFKDFSLRIQGENQFASRFSVKKDETASKFVIHPKKGWISLFTPYNKTYTVELTDKKDGSVYTASYTVEIPGTRPWIALIIWILAIGALIYMIGVFVTKGYFPKGTIFLYYADVIPSDEMFYIPEQLTIGQAIRMDLKRRSKNGSLGKYLLRHLFLWRQRLELVITEFAGGNFSHITLKALNKHSMIIKDQTSVLDDDGRYIFNFELYNRNFELGMDPNDISAQDPDGGVSVLFEMNNVIGKTEDLGGCEYFTHYLKITTKKAFQDETTGNL